MQFHFEEPVRFSKTRNELNPIQLSNSKTKETTTDSSPQIMGLLIGF